MLSFRNGWELQDVVRIGLQYVLYTAFCRPNSILHKRWVAGISLFDCLN